MNTGDVDTAGYHHWSEVASDWITGEDIEVRFATDGTHVWVWSPVGDGLDVSPEHNWIRVTPTSQ